MPTTQHDHKAAADRYKRMRKDGKLSHLTEEIYRKNLDSIGLYWHGPPPETGSAFTGACLSENFQ